MTSKLTWLVLLLVGICGLVAQPVPPVPKLPHGPIESPKGKEQHQYARVAPAAPTLVIGNLRNLTWKWTPDASNPASNVVFVVYSSLSLAVPIPDWPAIATCTTNGLPFVLSASVPSTFFYVKASNTVTHLVSVW